MRVLHVDSASTAHRRSIIFPPSLERLGLHNLLVSQARLVIESGQRLGRGKLQPGLRAEGRRLLTWRRGGGVGRAWVMQVMLWRHLPPTGKTHKPTGKPKGRHSRLSGGLIPGPILADRRPRVALSKHG